MIAFARSVAQKVGAGLNLDPDHVATTIVAGVKSTYVTGAALFAGLTVAAAAQGASTPQAFLAYYKSQWVAWLVTNIVAPTWRARDAYKAASANPTSAPAGAQEK